MLFLFEISRYLTLKTTKMKMTKHVGKSALEIIPGFVLLLSLSEFPNNLTCPLPTISPEGYILKRWLSPITVMLSLFFMLMINSSHCHFSTSIEGSDQTKVQTQLINLENVRNLSLPILILMLILILILMVTMMLIGLSPYITSSSFLLVSASAARSSSWFSTCKCQLASANKLLLVVQGDCWTVNEAPPSASGCPPAWSLLSSGSPPAPPSSHSTSPQTHPVWGEIEKFSQPVPTLGKVVLQIFLGHFKLPSHLRGGGLSPVQMGQAFELKTMLPWQGLGSLQDRLRPAAVSSQGCSPSPPCSRRLSPQQHPEHHHCDQHDHHDHHDQHDHCDHCDHHGHCDHCDENLKPPLWSIPGSCIVIVDQICKQMSGSCSS